MSIEVLPMNPAEQPSLAINGHVRGGLRLLVDLVLPGTDRSPAGVAVGAHEELLDRALRANPRLLPAVRTLGQRAADVGEVSVDDLLGWPAEQVEDLVFALTAAYYMSSEARRALGYPGQGRRPVSTATPEEKCSDDLLAPVIERGPIFRPTPEGKAAQ